MPLISEIEAKHFYRFLYQKSTKKPSTKNLEIKSGRIFEYAGRSSGNRFESFIGNQRGT